MFRQIASLFSDVSSRSSSTDSTFKGASPAESKETKKAAVESDSMDESDSDEEIEERPLYLTEFLADLFARETFADCFFIVGKGEQQVEIPAHRLVLAASSPVFETMLYPSSFPGDHDSGELADEPLTVVLEETDPEVFKALLTCVYADTVELSPKIIRALMDMGRKFQIEKVQQICLDYLSTDINPENACELLELSSVLSAQQFAINFVLDEAEDVFETKGFLQLSPERLLLLVRSDNLGIEEGALFKHVLRWALHRLEESGRPINPDEMKLLLRDIIPHIRFPNISPADIAGVVSESGLLSTDALLTLFQYLSVTDEKERQRIHSGFNSKPRSGGKFWDDSEILDREVRSGMKKIFETKKGVALKLLYRGSRDGFDSGTFHRLCDGKGATVSVVRTDDKKHIFGGYNGQSWQSSGSYTTPEAFIFSVKNSSGKPLKFTPTGSNHVYNNSSYGPTFGAGHDLHINSSMRTSSNYCVPSSYLTAAPGFTGSYSSTLFAGQRNFTVGEIEVFQVSSSAV